MYRPVNSGTVEGYGDVTLSELLASACVILLNTTKYFVEKCKGV